VVESGAVVVVGSGVVVVVGSVVVVVVVVGSGAVVVVGSGAVVVSSVAAEELEPDAPVSDVARGCVESVPPVSEAEKNSYVTPFVVAGVAGTGVAGTGVVPSLAFVEACAGCAGGVLD
jgi:hypothetical protein